MYVDLFFFSCIICILKKAFLQTEYWALIQQLFKCWFTFCTRLCEQYKKWLPRFIIDFQNSTGKSQNNFYTNQLNKCYNYNQCFLLVLVIVGQKGLLYPLLLPRPVVYP